MQIKSVKEKYSFLFISFLSLFVIFYPMLISIYVFLPLMIGTMSYLFLQGVQKDKPMYMFFTILYLINVEINRTLPLFLTMFSLFIFYILIYRGLEHFRSCQLCKPLISVVLLDVFYFSSLFIVDFIFKTHTIELDMMLLYWLVVDMLVVVLL